MTAARLKNTGRFGPRVLAKPAELTAKNIKSLLRMMDRDANIALPIRPQGAATSSTDCNQSPAGTVIRMTGLDRILNIDGYNQTVTAQAGVRLYALNEALAEHGFELIGNHEMIGRTLGAAIAAPCLGPGIGDESRSLGSNVISLKMITGEGTPMTISREQTKLLGSVRSSYGTLGVIVEATLKVQPITTFSVTHRRLHVEEFSSIVDTLSNSDVGFRFCVMPYRDRVYLDLRRYSADAGSAYHAPWKFKDWGESTIMPHLCKTLNMLLPIQSVRHRLIDSVSEATQGLVNSRFVTSGSNASAQCRTASAAKRVLYSSWCFPATDFSVVLKAYQEFCRSSYERTNYRCDLPAVGYRIARDNSAVLSPAFDETMIVLQTTSTQHNGWEDFVIDLSDFAETWGGVPIFNQTRSARADYAKQVYAARLEYFRRMRRQMDPEDRLLTPFMAQYFK